MLDFLKNAIKVNEKMYLNRILTNSDYSNNLRSNFSSETKIQLYKVTQIGVKPQIKISSNHQNVKERYGVITKLYEATITFQVANNANS